jgi:endonuclease/exonuclease/phosphatase (EEP) superfamily protein YafD
MAICFYAGEVGWAIFAAPGIAINLASVAPWYISRKKASGGRGGQLGRRRLRLALANVNHRNLAYERFVTFAQNQSPDVVIVQEVNDGWCEALRPLQHHYPFHETRPRDRGSGQAIYSRFRLERLPLALPEGESRPGLLVKLDVDGVAISLLSIHPRTPMRKDHFRLRNETLASAAECLQNLPGPKICIGDLNITPWSPYYRDFLERTKLSSVREGGVERSLPGPRSYGLSGS